MINIRKKQGFLNRHIENLPDKNCVIKIISKDIDGECILICEWNPFNRNDYDKDNLLNVNYLGTATVIEKKT